MSKESRVFKEGLAEALVDGWYGEWNMAKVIYWAFKNSGAEEPKDGLEKATEYLGMKHIWLPTPARVWIAKNFRPLNESLWAGRQRETAIHTARYCLGLKKKGTNYTVHSIRARDKRTDWKTVK